MARWRSPCCSRSFRGTRQGGPGRTDRIRQLALIALLPPIALSATCADAASFDHGSLAERARSGFVVPAYERLAGSLNRLRETAESLCEEPSAARLATARAVFRDTTIAWGGIEIVTFGPVARNNRLERIFFWPDRKGIGERQVRRLLAARDRRQIEPERLGEKSVALQGLTALELILHGDGADALATPSGDSFRCDYARAIVHNVSTMVADIRRAWADDGEFTRTWRTPGADNPAYLHPRETTLELVKTFDQALENVRDRRIAPAIGFGTNRRRMPPVLWRSRLSMALIAANIEAARRLLVEGGLADAYTAARNNAAAASREMSGISSELGLAVRAAGRLAKRADPFADPDIRSKLAGLGFPLRNVRDRTVSLVKQAAGLSIGFNASDGD